MTTIKNTQILRDITNRLQLVTPIDTPPDTLGNTIVPVFVVDEQGEHRNIFDAVLNDSNKSFVVPDNELWDIQSIHTIFDLTATVGSRRPTIRILNRLGTIVWTMTSGTALTASSDTPVLFQGDNTLAGLQNVQVQCPGPKFALAGYTIQVLDSAAIDAAADDMTVSINYTKFSSLLT